MEIANSENYVHSVPSAYRLLPSSSRWNSIEVDLNPFPHSSPPSPSSTTSHKYFSKSVQFNLIITDKTRFHRFLYLTLFSLFLILALPLILHFFLPKDHHHHASPTNLTIPVNRVLLFFDAQKSGDLPKNYSVKFRGDSGMQDGKTSGVEVDLVGGFYDSGNNIKFSFTTAYAVALLSWTAVEYRFKYEDIGELNHVKSVIKWGTDYLLKVFATSSSTSSDPIVLYSQVGTASDKISKENDISCWQRPEDMTYPRPTLICKNTSSDLAGEIIAALSAASIVLQDDVGYSIELVKAAEKLFEIATRDPRNKGTYTIDDQCGGEARQFYNSTGYLDELAWGAAWLYFATGNASYLGNATENFKLAMEAQEGLDNGVFYWNNKLPAVALLLTRLRYFHDPGFPYEHTLESSTNMTELVICSYISDLHFNKTPGGLILLMPRHGANLHYAVTASFLSKLYHDYLFAMQSPGMRCDTQYSITLEMLQNFSMSQVDYILGNNPMKMSYLVGYGENFPKQVHHRGASIPWDNQRHSCGEGKKWLYSKDPNPNVLSGSMVAGPNENDHFIDSRDKPHYTQPSISSNAGLVAALVALHEPSRNASSLRSVDGGLDLTGIFSNIR